ncbi:MAG: 4-hydroxy-tetrahydrodipicolinate synthase, partial [Bacteroidales bacterium]|nr:4-hydroxy-tetrahydrodipicolinate synthase [Bacteroidales bacterium]
MDDFNFLGTGVALVTPFNDDYSIDFTALGELIEFTITQGADYLVSCGTTGETPTLTREEKKEIVEFTKQKINKRLPLVVGIGSNDTAQVINSIKSTNLNGIAAILSVSPYYNKPNQKAIYQHYKSIAQVSPLPVIAYNV